MSDLVERLRQAERDTPGHDVDTDIFLEAADEIERLRAARDACEQQYQARTEEFIRAEGALLEIIDYCKMDGPVTAQVVRAMAERGSA